MTYELILLAVGILLTFFVHELGHALAARFYGVRVVSVSVGLGREIIGFNDRFETRWFLATWPLGGCCQFLDRRPVNATKVGNEGFSKLHGAKQAAIYLAGPLFSLALTATICLSVGRLDLSLDDANSVGLCALMIAGLSLFIALFSLLPIPPLDGGRLLLLAIRSFRGVSISETVEGQVFEVGTTILLIATLGSIAALASYCLL